MKIKSEIYEVHLHRNILGWKLKVDESFLHEINWGDMLYNVIQYNMGQKVLYILRILLYIFIIGHNSLHLL